MCTANYQHLGKDYKDLLQAQVYLLILIESKLNWFILDDARYFGRQKRERIRKYYTTWRIW